MLTLQLINQDPEDVIRRLAVKQFDAREPIMRIVELDKQRRALQKQRDDNAAVLNKMAAQIGALMKQGNRDEAENVKAQVAELKTANKEIDDNLTAAQDEITQILLNVPNVPYSGVPEGLRDARSEQDAAMPPSSVQNLCRNSRKLQADIS